MLEDLLLYTVLQGAVEQRVEHVVRDSDSVVGLDIFLERNTAMHMLVQAYVHADAWARDLAVEEVIRTWNPFSLSS